MTAVMQSQDSGSKATPVKIKTYKNEKRKKKYKKN
jgi:hypothetical protein